MPRESQARRYHAGQRWHFPTMLDWPESSLLILSVKQHPRLGTLCSVFIRCRPEVAEVTPFSEGVQLLLDAPFLDRSVSELLESKAPLPYWHGAESDFMFLVEEEELELQEEIEEATLSEETLDDLLMEAWDSLMEAESEEELDEDLFREPTSIFEAIAQGRLHWVEQFIEQDPECVHSFSSKGQGHVDQPLHWAACQGQHEICQVLLDAGADVNAKDEDGLTPLHCAARQGHAVVAGLLIAHGADLEKSDDTGNTPMIWATQARDPDGLEVAHLLQRSGAFVDLNSCLCMGWYDWACEWLRDNPHAVKQAPFSDWLLEDAVLFIRQQVWDATRRQSLADDSPTLEIPPGESREEIVAQHRELIELILAQGVDPNEGASLFHAVQLPCPSVAELLLAHGADPNRDLDEGIDLWEMAQSSAQSERLIALLDSYSGRISPQSGDQNQP
ncbi:Hypothetical protein PBC10988_22620 [Planctomycetales bacterium 10988]|nr:Hypothetical protein PBC10988_22620 [Planctomycetales bacterium 10988]